MNRTEREAYRDSGERCEGDEPTRVYFLVAIEAGALREPHLTEVTPVGPLLHHQRAHVLI